MQALPPFNPAQAQLMQQMMEQMMPQQEAPKGSPASFAGLLANYLEAQMKTTQQFIKELRNAEKQARKFEQEESKAAAGTRKRKKAADPSKPKYVPRFETGFLVLAVHVLVRRCKDEAHGAMRCVLRVAWVAFVAAFARLVACRWVWDAWCTNGYFLNEQAPEEWMYVRLACHVTNCIPYAQLTC